ncbi:unnamed protein product [Pleuronectes platessa]|uniref:Uncharacterized protein n=1 Tax=Pleuronectes platessa TaxID=8262 RepID=A0A9N7Y9U3_PLEPL|nr:unnamed protein product [Pleuronectes platessa]
MNHGCSADLHFTSCRYTEVVGRSTLNCGGALGGVISPEAYRRLRSQSSCNDAEGFLKLEQIPGLFCPQLQGRASALRHRELDEYKHGAGPHILTVTNCGVWGCNELKSLFMGGDSVPFRPGHGRVHQSPRIDGDSSEQWPCCGPINSPRLWHRGPTLASGNENYSSDSLCSPP